MIADIPPFAFALVAAFLLALGGQIQFLGVGDTDSRTGTMISIGASALVYWLAAPWLLEPAHFLHPAALIFAALGLIRPALSANLSVAAIRHIGPTLTSTLSATAPFFGTAFGILILGEMLTWQIALGTVGIVLSVVSLVRRDKRTPQTWPLWALALPIGAAMIRSLGHGFTKIGMAYIPDPYFVGLAGFSVSLLVTGGLHLAKPGGGVGRIDFRGGAKWFVIGGCSFGIGILSLNTALKYGDVVTVVPIIAAAPVFSMLLSIIVFRREHLTLRIAGAVLAVMASVVLIALSR